MSREAEALAASPSPAQHVVAFGHIPPFVRSITEGKGYYNYEPTTRNALISKLRSCGCTKLFCGHYHSNAGGHHEDFEVVITCAAGVLWLNSSYVMTVLQC